MRARCSRWPPFAVIVSSCDIQGGSAIAGDREIKASWVALHTLIRAAFASELAGTFRSAALSAVSVRATDMMLLSGQS